MSQAFSQPELVRFGDFEANLRTQELCKYGTKLRVPNQSFLILSALLERPGQLVTRDELRERLWPADTFVEYDQGLNAAVNRLREALGDSAEKPRFIETLPRRGYRFLAPIEIVPAHGRSAKASENDSTAESLPSSSGSEKLQSQASATARSVNPPTRTGLRRVDTKKLGMMAITTVAALLLAAVLIDTTSRSKPESLSSLRIVPFTSLPGQEVAPSFSPDGSQIAFAWSGESNQGFDLYVKTIGSERLLRLTDHASKWINPAWSPDGSQIAFSRLSEQDSGIFVVPALGGPERKLASAAFWYEPLMQISWSPDAKWLAFWSVGEAGSRVFLLPLDTLKPRMLVPDLHCWDTAGPAFSPDGKNLALICTSSIAVYAIYVVPMSGGSPRRLTSMMGYPRGLGWSADATRVIFSNDSGDGGELWQLGLGGNLSRLPFGEEGSAPAVSSRGDRLAYVRGSKTIDIWRVDLAAPKPENSDAKLISSTRIQRVPKYSPDGSKIVFESNRSGTHEIWLADGDGNNPVQLTSFNGPQTGSPSWCSDGRRIALDSRASGGSAIYVEDIIQRLPQPVQTNVQNLALPTWSEDCRWLFASDGHDTLYRIPSQGGDAVRVTDHSSWYSFTNHGRLFFNVKESKGVAIWSKPVDGGDETALEGMPKLAYTENWAATSRGIYYTDSTSNPPSINFYDFSSRAKKQVLSLPQEPTPGGGLSVSPDGRWLLYTRTDNEQSDIMLAEHFR
ncbi:MAG TPA: winged helix-turn-helix domain-containing protein [Terriglobales bacterium]|nr:winged helix-turn-helix domain-containing protein [Terriglobales bacterium]